MAVYVIEVLAIYENPGTSPTTPRVNARNSDFTSASNASAGVTHYTVTGQTAPEYLARFGRTGDEEPTSRYGFGWRARQYIVVRQDADTVGRAIWNQLSGRSLKDGSKTQVFEHKADEGNPFATGALLYQQSIPAQPTDVSLARQGNGGT